MSYREVENVDDQGTGYTRAVDMWSLGCLTACMFTGDTVIPRHELPELSHVEVAARYLGVDDSYAKMDWLLIPPRALRFIRRLLIINFEERMTADEALSDSWYTKPPREAQALHMGIGRLSQFWRRRHSKQELLEWLPGTKLASTITRDPPVMKAQRKILDASLSPYFSLDRHLQQREPSTRKRLLEDLSQSGSQFVTFKEPRTTNSSVNTSFRRGQLPKIIPVEGGDIFRAIAKESLALDPIYQSEDINCIPQVSMPRVEKSFDYSIYKPVSLPTASVPGGASIESLEATARTRTRKESEDKKIHEAAAKELPRYTTAKTLKETVNRLRGIALDSGSATGMPTV